MNSTETPHAKRKRGVVLSARGLRRLNQAIGQVEQQENIGRRFTAEELSSRTGVSGSTLSRLWSAKSGVDRRTLNLLFSAFQLVLLESDIQPVGEEVAAEQPYFDPSQASAIAQIPYPSGPVPPDCDRYIARPEIDDRALQEIQQPGCVLRIKAPVGFGKTSLLLRLLERAHRWGYAAAQIDLKQADTETLADPRSFLRWFCAVLSFKLNSTVNLDHYWDDLLGSKLSTTLFVKEGILAPLQHPLVLVINEVEQIFDSPNTAKTLLPLLRSWHEEAQHDVVWRRLRLVVSYSTDAYLPLDINQSPFNVGLPLSLPEFTREQVQTLAAHYAVDWSETNCTRLLEFLGGNPALVSLALYHLQQGIRLDDLLQSAPTQEGIYRNQLQRLLLQMNANPQLRDSVERLIQENAVSLDPVLAYKLEAIGLIKSTPGGWQLRCELYRSYFQNYLSNS